MPSPRLRHQRTCYHFGIALIPGPPRLPGHSKFLAHREKTPSRPLLLVAIADQRQRGKRASAPPAGQGSKSRLAFELLPIP